MVGGNSKRKPVQSGSSKGKRSKRTGDPFLASSKAAKRRTATGLRNRLQRRSLPGTSVIPAVKTEGTVPAVRMPGGSHLLQPSAASPFPGSSDAINATPTTSNLQMTLRQRPRRSVQFAEDTIDDDEDSDFNNNEHDSEHSNEDGEKPDIEDTEIANAKPKEKPAGGSKKNNPAHECLTNAFDYEAENPSVKMANRTMCGIVYERYRDITRQIILNGDQMRGYLGEGVDSSLNPATDIVAWPAVDIHRYVACLQPGLIKLIGADPLGGCEKRHEYMSLEEPGEEWDSRQLGLLAECSDGGDSEAEQDDLRYTGNEPAFTDGSEISDSTKNGGIGLVIKRQHHDKRHGSDGIYQSDPIKLVTKHQILNKGILEPRYSRVPAQSELCSESHNDLSPNFDSLLEITRSQVLNQIMASNAAEESLYCRNDAEPCTADEIPPVPVPFPLSKFVSSTVAKEAVASIASVWSKVRDIREGSRNASATGRGNKILHPGMHETGWIAILEAALLAGIPTEVVARSFHRLEKLCDVPTKEDSKRLSAKLSHRESRQYRSYRPDLQRAQATGSPNPPCVDSCLGSEDSSGANDSSA
ncbi:hypothetical protein GGI12_001027 [Dipsacomyces acuminosporus]|nr:hypothetical protein GGI12_001027 [Dipsacomyces acuminosporus]